MQSFELDVLTGIIALNVATVHENDLIRAIRSIEKVVVEKGIETNFIHLEDGSSWINVKIKSDDETKLNG